MAIRLWIIQDTLGWLSIDVRWTNDTCGRMFQLRTIMPVWTSPAELLTHGPRFVQTNLFLATIPPGHLTYFVAPGSRWSSSPLACQRCSYWRLVWQTGFDGCSPPLTALQILYSYLLKTCYIHSLHITRWPNVDICSVVWCHNVEVRFAFDLVYRYWDLHVLADD